jgi:hypothetical protein
MFTTHFTKPFAKVATAPNPAHRAARGQLPDRASVAPVAVQTLFTAFGKQ